VRRGDVHVAQRQPRGDALFCAGQVDPDGSLKSRPTTSLQRRPAARLRSSSISASTRWRAWNTA